MARALRNIITGLPYQITQRGNYRQPVFLTDNDYLYYQELLWDYGQRYGMAV